MTRKPASSQLTSGFDPFQYHDLSDLSILCVFTTKFRLNYEWKDPRLAWNASHANGIEDVRLNIKDIWLPDIEVYNLVSKKALRREGEDQVNIKFILSPEDVNSRWF